MVCERSFFNNMSKTSALACLTRKKGSYCGAPVKNENASDKDGTRRTSTARLKYGKSFA